jgi:hypothetical protein
MTWSELNRAERVANRVSDLRFLHRPRANRSRSFASVTPTELAVFRQVVGISVRLFSTTTLSIFKAHSRGFAP